MCNPYLFICFCGVLSKYGGMDEGMRLMIVRLSQSFSRVLNTIITSVFVGMRR